MDVTHLNIFRNDFNSQSQLIIAGQIVSLENIGEFRGQSFLQKGNMQLIRLLIA